jgi:hypothetical protein
MSASLRRCRTRLGKRPSPRPSPRDAGRGRIADQNRRVAPRPIVSAGASACEPGRARSRRSGRPSHPVPRSARRDRVHPPLTLAPGREKAQCRKPSPDGSGRPTRRNPFPASGARDNSSVAFTPPALPGYDRGSRPSPTRERRIELGPFGSLSRPRTAAGRGRGGRPCGRAAGPIRRSGARPEKPCPG